MYKVYKSWHTGFVNNEFSIIITFKDETKDIVVVDYYLTLDKQVEKRCEIYNQKMRTKKINKIINGHIK
jgi:phage anti-repressor protein